MTIIKINEHEFYMDEFLKRRLDTLKHIVHKKNWDGVILLDGLERVGKSTLGITIGYYLSDGKFTVNNICVDNDDAIKKIESFPDKSVLLVDEGSLVFSSKDAMKKEQKRLMKILNVVGQKNMIFIIVLPSFFDLNKQIAIRRSKFLLHCYTNNTLQRGRFAYFGEDAKKKLYSIGKKNFDSYQYPKRSSNELGRFTDFNPLGQEYIETKKKSLFSALHEDERATHILQSEKIYSKIIEAIEEFQFPFKITQENKAKMLGISRKTYCKYKVLAKRGGCMPVEGKKEPYINNPYNLCGDNNIIKDTKEENNEENLEQSKKEEEDYNKDEPDGTKINNQ